MTKIIVVGKPEGTPKEKSKVEPQNYRSGFLTRVLQIIADDIRNAVFKRKIIVGKEPEGWNDYQRFCELARGKK